MIKILRERVENLSNYDDEFGSMMTNLYSNETTDIKDNMIVKGSI